MEYTLSTSTVTVFQTKLIGEIMDATAPVLSQWYWDAQAQTLYLDFDGTLSAQEEIDVQTLLDNHDPVDYIAIVSDGAEAQAQNIPGWAVWNEATALQWIEDNLTAPLAAIPDHDTIETLTNVEVRAALADMRDLLDILNPIVRNLGRFVIASRNRHWPNLQE